MGKPFGRREGTTCERPPNRLQHLRLIDLSDLLAHHPYSKGYFLYWETFMRLASFLTTALTLAKIKESSASERRLNEELCRVREENHRMHCALGDQAPAVAAGKEEETLRRGGNPGTSRADDSG